jgi:carbamoyl-phosphate synthase large subunit
MKVKVMVTGVGGGGHGEQILKALRLASTEYEIVGSDMSPLSKGLQDVDYPYILPPASDRRYIDSLLVVCQRHGVQALFHGSEPELKVMSANRVRIEAEDIFLPINPQHVINTCMDKFKTYNFLKEHNFNPPRTERINSKADILRVDYLPVVIKPSIGGGGSANIFLAQNQKELKAFGEHLLDIYPEFIVQQYVGTPDSEYTVGVLISMDGELINSIAVKRTL